VSLLARHYEWGRRFEVLELIEQGEAVAVGLRIADPDWSDVVDVFKVFLFRADDMKVVHMQDCVDRAGALAAIAAG
jgi:hypothetical protein